MVHTVNTTIDTVVITPVVLIEGPSIEALRTAAVESESTVYGARRKYAAGINGLAGDVAWYREGVALPKVVELEKKEYYKALKAIGYSNPSNAWRMVKEYAKENALEFGLFGEVAKEVGEGEVDAESTTREARSITLRMIEELTVLHKACVKSNESGSQDYTDKVKNAHGFIVDALKAMGVDIGI